MFDGILTFTTIGRLACELYDRSVTAKVQGERKIVTISSRSADRNLEFLESARLAFFAAATNLLSPRVREASTDCVNSPRDPQSVNQQIEAQIRRSLAVLARNNEANRHRLSALLDRAFQEDLRTTRSDSAEIRRTLEKFLTMELLLGSDHEAADHYSHRRPW